MVELSKYYRAIFITALLSFVTGLAGGVYIAKLRGVPFVAKKEEWSIGIYIGESPFRFSSPENITNPVLTALDVTDVSADYVADPFMVKEDSKWYMFFEVKNAHTRQGDIGLATSDDGFHWAYSQIVLDEPFTLSYPYVFKWKGDYYMIPECHETNTIRLYKAVDFPKQWSFVGILLKGSYVDPSILQYNAKWWLFIAERNPKGEDTLRLYYANDLMGPWIEHPKSPVIKGDANIARPGGRVILFNGRIIRYTQDDKPTYGNQVRAFEITELTTTTYSEEGISENPILKASGRGWNGIKMHNIDPHQIGENSWIACVDGCRRRLSFGFKY